MTAGSSFPASHSLKDVAKFYLKRLAEPQRAQLLERVEGRGGRPLRVGTLCSGTDSPIPVLKNLAKALGGKLQVEHTFSCEFDPKKREWIRDNFPELPCLFGDVTELQSGTAYCHVAEKVVKVPPVDVVIAGFVCKSVSSENNERERFADCIRQAVGKTGETFAGVIGYVERFQPALVICENVEGLVKRNRGAEPVINHVKESFEAVNYSFGCRVLDTRDYLLPQRRHRCWMWAMRGARSQPQAELVGESVLSLSTKEAWSFSYLFNGAQAKDEPMRRALNEREQRVVDHIMGRIADSSCKAKLIIDINKSEGRAPHCVGFTTCIVPNSRPYLVGSKKVLSPQQVHAVQGIFREDFPALERWAQSRQSLTRDLAGNAFSTTVCMAVLVSCLAHLPVSRCSRSTSQKEIGAPAPGTPPPRAPRAGAPVEATPPRVVTRGAKRRLASLEATPSKRRRQ